MPKVQNVIDRIILLAFLLWPTPALAAEFDGYPCQTAECSGHRAGYDWAERKNITDPADCGGKSQSFIEGCQAYAEGGRGGSTLKTMRKAENEVKNLDKDGMHYGLFLL